MKFGFLIMGVGVGCWMYAFVNTRYNEQKWANSNLFWGLGGLLFIVSLLIFFF